ncbi:MAG: hypothetical protein HRU01_28925 [Myxococcales bacterium]|nr:hypothetical protein [Myxococcales bacterium]
MYRSGWLPSAALALLLASPESAVAYDVEADSAANTVFILLWNDNPSASFDSISISDDLPAFVSQATPSIVPASVPASGSDLAAVDFDVSAGATIGSLGDLELTVSGTASGQPIQLVLTVPLEVVADAAEAQGVVGVGVPTPDPGGVDADGDGVTDALEIAFGSDPLDPNSMPGGPEFVPMLSNPALVALALLMVLSVAWAARRRPPVRFG